MKSFSTVPASTLKYKVLVSKPRYSKQELPGLVSRWMQLQKHLPKRLAANHVMSNLQPVYVPCWVSSIRASCKWHGRYSESHKKEVEKKDTCSKCNGDGSVFDAYSGKRRCRQCGGTGYTGTTKEETIIFRWKKASGNASIDVTDFALPATRSRIIYLDLYKGRTPTIAPTSQQLQSIRILSPKHSRPTRVKKQLTKRASVLLKEKAAIDAGYISGAKIRRYSKVIIEGKSPYLWLCPMYMGKFKHGLSTYHVQINMTNGDMFMNKIPNPLAYFLPKIIKYAVYPGITAVIVFNVLNAVF